MATFIEILFVLIGLIAVSEFATVISMGRFIPKKIRNAFMHLDTTKMRLNRYDPSILNLNKNMWVTNTPLSILSKYYINNFGTVPRWSKLHREIERYYEEVLSLKIQGS